MMDTVTITQRHLPPELRGLPCIRAEVAHVIAPEKPRLRWRARYLTGMAISIAA